VRLRRFQGEEDWVEACLGDFLAAHAEAAAEARGLELVLAGGSTPGPIYRRLAALELPGPAVRLWPGDERRLALGHPERNDSSLAPIFAGAPWKPAPEFMAWPDADDAEPDRGYAERLASFMPEGPRFDLVFLGIGNDGHTASLFPGDAASEAALEGDFAPLALLSFASSRPWLRMSLSGPVLAATRRLLFLTRGPDKLSLLERTMGEERKLPWRRVAALAEAGGASVQLLHADR